MRYWPLLAMTVSRAPASGAARSQAMLIAALLVVTIAALLIRCLAIAEPLGIDQSLWASAVRGMSRGQRLYHDVWEQRPPGIYWIYYAGFSVFGWTPATVAWLDIGASALTTLALFALGRALGDTLTGAAAAAAYAVLTMPAWLYGHGGFLERSVCETFIAVCIALGAWCAVRVRDTGSLAAAAGLGLTAGMAVVLKPNAGLYFPALLLWLVLYRRDAMADVVRSVIAAIAASEIVPALALLCRRGLLASALRRGFLESGLAADEDRAAVDGGRGRRDGGRLAARAHAPPAARGRTRRDLGRRGRAGHRRERCAVVQQLLHPGAAAARAARRLAAGERLAPGARATPPGVGDHVADGRAARPARLPPAGRGMGQRRSRRAARHRAGGAVPGALRRLRQRPRLFGARQRG